jgi:hypothetical protein
MLWERPAKYPGEHQRSFICVPSRQEHLPNILQELGFFGGMPGSLGVYDCCLIHRGTKISTLGRRDHQTTVRESTQITQAIAIGEIRRTFRVTQHHWIVATRLRDTPKTDQRSDLKFRTSNRFSETPRVPQLVTSRFKEAKFVIDARHSNEDPPALNVVGRSGRRPKRVENGVGSVQSAALIRLVRKEQHAFPPVESSIGEFSFGNFAVLSPETPLSETNGLLD